MMNKKKFNLFFISIFIFSIFLISFVSAQPPFDPTVLEAGVEIIFPQFDTLKADTDFKFHFHTTNESNGMQLTNTTLTCSFHLYNSTGNHLIELTNDVPFEGPLDWEAEVLGGNLTTGCYGYLFQCNNTVQELGGQVSIGFCTTPSGSELNDEEGIVLFGIMLILIVLIVFFFISTWHIENEPFKIFLGSLAVLLMVGTLGFGFTIMEQLFSTFTNIVAGYSLFYRLFIILLMGAAVGLMVFLIVFALKKFNESRGTFPE